MISQVQSRGEGALLFFVRIILFIFVIYIFYLVSRAVVQNIELKRQKSTVLAQIEDQKMTNQRLEEEIAYQQTSTFKEKELRRRLGYKKPGEVVISIPDNADPLTESSAGPEEISEPLRRASRANYQLWFEYFFGRR